MDAVSPTRLNPPILFYDKKVINISIIVSYQIKCYFWRLMMIYLPSMHKQSKMYKIKLLNIAFVCFAKQLRPFVSQRLTTALCYILKILMPTSISFKSYFNTHDSPKIKTNSKINQKLNTCMYIFIKHYKLPSYTCVMNDLR